MGEDCSVRATEPEDWCRRRPEELTKEDIKSSTFLLQSLSPGRSKRTDEYGDSFENGTRLMLEIVGAVCRVTRYNTPLFRGQTGWKGYVPNEPSLTPRDASRLASILFEHVIDVSSGGLHRAQKPRSVPGYLALFAKDALQSAAAGWWTALAGLYRKARRGENPFKEEFFVGRPS